MKRGILAVLTAAAVILGMHSAAFGLSEVFKESVFDPGHMKPVDSALKVAIGQPAPDFELPAVTGGKVSLGQYRGKKNVVISFVPAAWTPVCSDQWPGYNIARPLFEANDAVLLGISVDNVPTLYSWTRQMGDLWFPVLSDFWPHGKAAESLGVLRSDGVTERALLVVDKNGILRAAHVGDINVRPPLEWIMTELAKLKP